MKLYLAGPITKCNKEEAETWRREFEEEFGENNCYNPLDLDYFDEDFGIWRWLRIPKEAIKIEKAMILDSDYVIANMNKTESIGTFFEIMFAFCNEIPVLLCSEYKEIREYEWINEHCKEVFENIEELKSYLRKKVFKGVIK